jgi:hypothetical protein
MILKKKKKKSFLGKFIKFFLSHKIYKKKSKKIFIFWDYKYSAANLM